MNFNNCVESSNDQLKAKELIENQDINNSNTYMCKGIVLKNLNELNKAIEFFNKSIEINQYDSLALYNKGICLIRLRKYEEAIKCFEKLVEINPNDSFALYNKGIALCGLSKFKELNAKNSSDK